jgi:hypothetical protein
MQLSEDWTAKTFQEATTQIPRRIAMRIQIVCRKLHCEESMTDYIRRRIHFALGRFAPAIQSVQVYLGDENGPRGGQDKRCRVLIVRKRSESIVVEKRGANVHEVVAQSLQRAGHSLARLLGRKRLGMDMDRNAGPAVF